MTKVHLLLQISFLLKWRQNSPTRGKVGLKCGFLLINSGNEGLNYFAIVATMTVDFVLNMSSEYVAKLHRTQFVGTISHRERQISIISSCCLEMERKRNVPTFYFARVKGLTLFLFEETQDLSANSNATGSRRWSTFPERKHTSTPQRQFFKKFCQINKTTGYGRADWPWESHLP